MSTSKIIFFSRNREIITEAIVRLQNLEYVSSEAQKILLMNDMLERRDISDKKKVFYPKFISDISEGCSAETIVNCNHKDFELPIQAGYSIESSALMANSFAQPYYIDPLNGNRRCKHLNAVTTFCPRYQWEYDISFIGFEGLKDQLSDTGCILDTTRFFFFKSLEEDNYHFDSWQSKIVLNKIFFFYSPEIQTPNYLQNNQQEYLRTITNSKYVLCPRGRGSNSIRFFETLACCNIPIFIGTSQTKFPLDWIIDWDKMTYKIFPSDISDRTYQAKIDQILRSPSRKVNEMREYIFNIYHQLLSWDPRQLFEVAILLKTFCLLNCIDISL